MFKYYFLWFFLLYASIWAFDENKRFYRIPITTPEIVLKNQPIKTFNKNDSLIISKKYGYTALFQKDSMIDPRSVLITLDSCESYHQIINKIEGKSRSIQRIQGSRVAFTPQMIAFAPIMFPAMWLPDGGYKQCLQLWNFLIAKYNADVLSENKTCTKTSKPSTMFEQIDGYFGIGASGFSYKDKTYPGFSLKGGVHEHKLRIFGGYNGYICPGADVFTAGGYGFFSYQFDLYKNFIFMGPSLNAGFVYADNDILFGGPGGSIIYGKGFKRIVIDYIFNIGASSFAHSLSLNLMLSI